ncbi:MAG: peptidylprolyl isomerase [Pirellulales bacterium]
MSMYSSCLRWLTPRKRGKVRRRKPFARVRFESLEHRRLLHGDGEPHDHAPGHTLDDHIHAQLSIFVDGAKVAIPANIGMTATAFLSFIHTHDASGVLHIHPINGQSPTEFLTVGDFFDTWRTNAGLPGNNPNAIFNDSQILGNLEGNTHLVRMYVNGVASQDFENYVIHDRDHIVISYLPKVEPDPQNPIVTLETNFGPIPIELFAGQTPLTVANFLNYVNDDDYVNSIIHRVVPGFVVQGGGFTTTSIQFTSASQIGSVPVDDPVVNEPGFSNTRGTVAMAKLPDQPDSATSQFFVNIGDNSANLDQQNGGFTVFGRVLDMTVVDVINAIAPQNIDAARGLTAVPVTADNPLVTTGNQLVVVEEVDGNGTARGVQFADLNRNAVRDPGEPGLAGFTIFVDANGNGQPDAGEPSTTTAADGSYSFRLTPGDYTIRAVAPAGTEQTTPASGRHQVTIPIGGTVAALDFGVFSEAPLAVADKFRFQGDSLTAPAPGILENDSHIAAGALVAALVTSPSKGALLLNADGSFTYTPGANFDGLDSFTYQARAGVASGNVVTVELESEDHRFVVKLFNDLLGRTPSQSDAQFWYQQLRDGAGREEVARRFRATFEPREQLVQSFYQEFLNREGEEQGVTYWIDRLNGGEPQEMIAAGFVNSPEYFRLHGSDNDAFLMAAYDQLADTVPDPPGMEFWRSTLDAGTERLAVIFKLCETESGRAMAVDRLYSQLLGRAADPEGRDFWLNRPVNGSFLDELTTGLLATDEYLRRGD